MDKKMMREKPLWCYIRRRIGFFSPSAVMVKCTAGLAHGTSKCERCPYYVPRIMKEGFDKGFKEGLMEEGDK